MTSAEFEPESIRVTRRLRDDILDGVRPPGSRLVERELAAELEVSRVPVRDALRTLVTEGLVTARPRSWAVVREFTDRDVDDLTEVRSAFEVLAFRLAAERRTPEGLARLRAVLDVELDAARRGDAIGARRAAADFHELVVELSGNALIDEAWCLLSSRLRWLLGRHDDLEAVAAEHLSLYEVVATGDGAAAEAAARVHITAGAAHARSMSPSSGTSGD